jgi:hypothetical protein
MFGALSAAAVVMSAMQRMIDGVFCTRFARSTASWLAQKEALAVVCGVWRLAVLSFVSSRWSVIRNGPAAAICGSARPPTRRNSLRIYGLQNRG